MTKGSYLFAVILFVSAISNACSVTSGNEEPGPPGALQVTVSTEGPDQDRDGYDVTIDIHSLSSSINDEILINNLDEGTYELRLEGLDNACSVAGENPQSVSIASDETTTTSFNVECEEVVLKNTIVYRHCEDTCEGLYLMDGDGANQRQLTSHSWDSDPIISPDGTKIAFVNGRRNPDVSEHHSEIYIVDASGYPVTSIPRPAESLHDANPSWSPDGEKLVFSQTNNSSDGNDIVSVNVDGTDRIKITSDSPHDQRPLYTRDGSQILFYSLNREGGAQIFKMNSDGSDITRITDFDFFVEQLALSNDGSMIAFSIQDDPKIYSVNSDGTGFRPVTDNTSGSFAWPSWSHDDGQLIFFDFDTSDIYKVNLDGTGLTNITNSSGIAESDPFWSPVQ